MKEHLQATHRTKILGLPLSRHRSYLFQGQSVEFDTRFSDRVVTKVKLAEEANIMTVTTVFTSKPSTEKKYDLRKQKKVRVRTGILTQIFKAYDPSNRLNA